jgi:hypothetical protein
VRERSSACRAHLRYGWYVARHKWFVLVSGLKLGVPLWRLIIHDASKLTPAEWGPYVRRFYGGRAGQLDKADDPDDFHRAWMHHWHHNAHHWEHWLTFDDAGGYRPLKMPPVLVREMVADWMGAGRAITCQWNIDSWYSANSTRMTLHPDVRRQVEMLLVDYGLVRS